MVYKRLLGLAVIFMLFTLPVSALMVSVLVVETGIGEDISPLPHARLWESGLMDAFFDAGHIVTNSPVFRIKNKPSGDLGGLVEDDYNEAVAGGAEYFVLCFLEYQNRGTSAVPVGIEMRLYKTDSKKSVFEQSFPAGSGKNNNEEYQMAKNAGITIISRIKDK